ncbi:MULTISPECIES: hypothetical protein [Sphingomonas]|uniref:hypothetical protein n=1 Tax=Sphingomonas TaxID=13687 RepID=UPI000DEF6BB6|nr:MULTISPECIES: hypothetical protein [Sphingomonas]
MPQIAIGAAVAGLGSIAGAAISSHATTKAANTAAAAQQQATDSQLQIANQEQQLWKDNHAEAVKNLTPWMDSGTVAQQRVMDLLGLQSPTSLKTASMNAMQPAATPTATTPTGATATTGAGAGVNPDTIGMLRRMGLNVGGQLV